MKRHRNVKIKPVCVESSVAYVPLSKGYEAIIDVEDLHLVENYNWCAIVESHTVYAMRTDYSGPTKKTVYLASMIMECPEGFQVDHLNHNGLDNRRRGDTNNLRIVTGFENAANKRIQINNSSGAYGIVKRSDGKWRARIRRNHKVVWDAQFITKDEAVNARQQMLAQL